MITALTCIGIVLVFWIGLWMSSDYIYDKTMARIERWKREHRRTH
jgi:hypothetical protein